MAGCAGNAALYGDASRDTAAAGSSTADNVAAIAAIAAIARVDSDVAVAKVITPAAIPTCTAVTAVTVTAGYAAKQTN